MTISILELNTFAHALCTLLIFGLWWDKPLDVIEPTLIQGESAHPFIALIRVLDDEGFETKGYRKDYFGSSSCRKCPHNLHVGFQHMPSNTASANGRNFQAEKDLYEVKVPLLPGFIRAVELEPFQGYTPTFRRRCRFRHTTVFHRVADFPQSLIQCLELARSATRGGMRTNNNKYLQNRIKNIRLPNGDYKEDERVFCQAMIGITIAGLTYGGLHLTAWNVPMPSTTKLLWRVGCVLVTLSGPACLPVAFVRYRSYRSTWYDLLLDRLGLGYAIVATLVYVAARIFLVVECFINVRHLPASTFQVPQWSQYFPHIS
jgi:hypothetical protein